MQFIKLKDIADVISGVNYDKSDIDKSREIRILRGGNIQNGRIVFRDDDVFLPSEYSNDKNCVKYGDTIITASTGSVEMLGKPASNFDELSNTYIGAFLRIIRPKNIKDAVWISCIVRDNIYKQYIHHIAGTSINNISKGYLEKLPVIQQTDKQLSIITSIIGKLDRSISLQRKSITILESMAKQIYDYWFVQFDFPDENGRPYKSSGGKMVWNEKLKREIPEGWGADKVSELIEPIERGVSYTSEEIKDINGLPMLNLACFSKDGSYRTGEMKYYSGELQKAKSVKPFDMLIACTDMTQEAAIIGRPILATKEYENYTFSTDLALLHPSKVQKMYLYYTLHTSFYHKYIRPFASGTTVKHLNVKGVEDYKIPIPGESLQLRFEKIVTDIKEMQFDKINEIKQLTNLRDELLPLLMNGQVTVE